MKYRKKPVVIEASQWFRIGDHAAVLNYHEAYDKGYRHPTPTESGIANVNNRYTGKGLIQTLEGWHEVTPGDYIIEGVKGELYPCNPAIFAMTYEVAE